MVIAALRGQSYHLFFISGVTTTCVEAALASSEPQEEGGPFKLSLIWRFQIVKVTKFCGSSFKVIERRQEVPLQSADVSLHPPSATDFAAEQADIKPRQTLTSSSN